MKILQTLSGALFGSSAVKIAQVLPQPRSLRWARTSPTLYLSSHITFDAPDDAILQCAWSRTSDALWSGEFYSPDAQISEVNKTITDIKVTIEDLNAPLQFGVDESYSIKTAEATISIASKTIWGALHALTSIQQLTLTDSDGLPFIEGYFQIQDEPLYPHRGLMIDTSRNFYSVNALFRQIDALSYAKMNVFHWHITDQQSWPIYIKTYPEMIKDAYSPREIYSIDDVKNIIQYAAERGVRVIPEIDMPGHSAAGWKQINPDLIICENCPWQKAAVEPTPGQLDVLADSTYDVVRNVYNDLSALFPDNFFHVGLDELNAGCYNTSEKYREFLKSENRGYSAVVDRWLEKVLPIVNAVQDRRIIMWQDVVTSPDMAATDPPKNITLQAWSGGVEAVQNLTAKGYDVIVASSDFWYLDCGMSDWVFGDTHVDVQNDPTPGQLSYNYGGSGGSWCAPYKSWQRIYSFNFNSELSAEQKKHVLGGSLQLWSEQSDTNTADGIVWPRTGAGAELLWSGNVDSQGKIRLDEFAPRILQFRERLVAKGIGATPIAPKWCLRNPQACAWA